MKKSISRLGFPYYYYAPPPYGPAFLPYPYDDPEELMLFILELALVDPDPSLHTSLCFCFFVFSAPSIGALSKILKCSFNCSSSSHIEARFSYL